MRMFDRAALAALSAVLDTGSFELAAAKLGLTQSAVSRRIKVLEDMVGTTLILRTRPTTATEAGQRLAAHAETLALLERDVGAKLAMVPDRRATPLRIVVTADSLATWVIPALPRAEGLFYDLIIDDQDHSVDLLRRGEAAAAITARAAPLTGCDVTALGPLDYAAFASPAFVDRYFAKGIDGPALQRAPALTYNRKDRLQLAWAAQAVGAPVPRLPTHYLPSTDGITTAACAGLGWAVNPVALVQGLFDSGALVRLRPDIVLQTPLYWQVPRQNKAALADLTRSLQRGARHRAHPASARNAAGKTLPKG